MVQEEVLRTGIESRNKIHAIHQTRALETSCFFTPLRFSLFGLAPECVK